MFKLILTVLLVIVLFQGCSFSVEQGSEDKSRRRRSKPGRPPSRRGYITARSAGSPTNAW